MMKLFKILIVLSLLSNIIFGQETNSERYKKDLRILKKSFEKNYPSLYRFKSRVSINKLFDKCSQNINNNTTVREFYKTIKLILSNIEDGHLSCTPPDSLTKQFDEIEKYFPFSLYFIDNKAYVDCSHISNFTPGIEIIKINGININTIRKTLFNYIVSDGRIETKKYWILNHSFWFYYNLVYGESQKYCVKYKDYEGKLLTIVVKGELRKYAECKSLTEQEDDKLLNLKCLNQNIALLTIRTFAEDDFIKVNLNFMNFLDSTFKDIKTKNTSSLIIDLRGNGGGRDVYGSLLYSYLTDTAFLYYRRLETSTKVLNENEHPNLVTQKPNPNNFKGRVYVLINGLSFSATSEFCTVAKNYDRATFIGEETGGTYCGNTSGNFVEMTLPFSKIIINIPTTKYTMFTTDGKNKDRGIIPNYLITPTIKELIHKKDVQLDLAIKLAENKITTTKKRHCFTDVGEEHQYEVDTVFGKENNNGVEMNNDSCYMHRCTSE